MTLGERIRELRQARGLTQRQLAKAVGIDFSYLSKIENGRLEHTPSLKTLQKLAEVLKADELELLELADKVPPLLREITNNREAIQFFRKANKVLKSPRAWRLLARQLDEIEKNLKPTKKGKSS